MDQLKNFLPLIIFVAVYVSTDIYTATAALMIAVTVQVVAYLLLKKPLSFELKLTFWVGLVMGSMTLFFQDERFIQWKTTVVNWLMASGLIATHFFGKSYGTEVVFKKLLQNAAEKAAAPESAPPSTEPESLPSTRAEAPTSVEAPTSKGTASAEEKAKNKAVWRNVNLLWIASFAIAGALNLFVAANFSLDFWVTYKLVGGMVLTFLTIILTMIYLHQRGFLDELAPPEEAATAIERETL